MEKQPVREKCKRDLPLKVHFGRTISGIHLANSYMAHQDVFNVSNV